MFKYELKKKKNTVSIITTVRTFTPIWSCTKQNKTKNQNNVPHLEIFFLDDTMTKLSLRVSEFVMSPSPSHSVLHEPKCAVND